MLLVTFSGLDGSGKTTHAARTGLYLATLGYRVRVLATAGLSLASLLSRLWRCMKMPIRHRRKDSITIRVKDVCPRSADATRPRSSTDTQGTAGCTTEPSMPVAVGRFLAYPIDCLILAVAIRMLARSGHTAVVCDRYVFDKLVNLARPGGRFGRWLYRLAPRPDLALFLAAAPAEARRRRPEHSPDYYDRKHAGYEVIADAGLGMVRIPDGTFDETATRIESTVAEAVSRRATVSAPACRVLSISR